MIYQELSKELLAFVSNPIANKSFIKQTNNFEIAIARGLSLTSITQKLLSKKQSRLLFERELSKLLDQCSVKTLGDAENKINIKNQSDLNRVTKMLRNFFNIGMPMSEKEMADQECLGKASAHIDTHLLTKFEYHSNRITEAYNLPEQHLHNILEEKKTWICFYLSEIYLLLHIGALAVRYVGNRYDCQPTPAFDSRRKTYWYSEIAESSSRHSDLKLFYDISMLLQRQKYLPASMAKTSVDYVLDKYFSINVRYLPDTISEDGKYILLREILYFAIVVECKTIQSESFFSLQYFMNDPHIHSSSLSQIYSELASIEEAKIAGKGGLFFRQGFDEVYRGPLSFKHGLKKFVTQVLSAVKTFEKGKDFLGELGRSFEHDYVIKYLKSLNSYGYTVHPGFKAGRKSKLKGYDIDLIIEDTENEIFYFVQAKYRFTSLPTYFSEQFELFGQNTFKKGYIDQLITLKQNFDHPEILQHLKSKKLSRATLDNSHFILLHNLPFLNFYEHKGVIFYEWNLLRNMLQNVKVYWQRENSTGVTHGKKVPLFSPSDMVDAYLESQEHGHEFREQYSLFKRSKCFIEYGEFNFEAPLL